MGRLNVSVGGGGGVSSDEVTAALSDVLEGKTALTSDSNDEIGTGTMVDQSGTSQSATASLDATNSRLQMTVPKTGKYSTSSKLYAAYSTIRSLIGLTAAKIISGNTILGLAGTATSDATISAASQLLKGVIAYGKNGVKYTGTIASLAAKTYTPGTSNQTIAAGQYLSGAQTIKGDSNLKAANIKKGVSIFGITGTFEGYADKGTLILYDRETYWSGSTSKSGMSVPSGMDYLQSGNSGGSITFKNVPLAGYQTLHVTYDPSYKDVNGFSTDYFKARLSASDRVSVSITPTATGSVTKTLDVSGCNDNYDIYLDFNNGYTNLFKVWLD